MMEIVISEVYKINKMFAYLLEAFVLVECCVNNILKMSITSYLM